MMLPNSISHNPNANGTQTMPRILILFLLVAGLGALAGGLIYLAVRVSRGRW